MPKIYATCPQSKDVDRSRYLAGVADVARWSERAGCTGILVYTDNGIVDPWLVSQVVIEATERLCPLVAVQPVYLHPYAMAKMVASIAFLHGRAVHLNMLAGGFRNDLLALGDSTAHDERYARTVEYTRIAMDLLRGQAPVSVDGRYYSVTNLSLAPAVPAGLVPEVLVSGSSPAGLHAARALGATPVKYPQPPGEEQTWVGEDADFGVRVGVITRPDADGAWRVAHDRFPADRAGQITHRLATAVSDSHWHRQLSRRPDSPDGTGEPDPYWLGPFQNYQTFCPYLVGSYDSVARMLAHYLDIGSNTFILDIPAAEEELVHIGAVFAKAQELVAA
ncbi:MAG: LLM class flavin-dependent oxidoreductase [Pseudonocardia sp.]